MKRWNSCHGRAVFHRIGFDMLMFVSYQVWVQKKAGAAKRSLRIYDQTFRWDSCRVFMCSTNRSIVGGALAWNGWFYIQLGSNRYSATPYDKDRKNAVGIWKTLAKLNIRSSKFAGGQTTLLAPPRLIYHFASWGKWNVPTPVALLDDISCLIEASQKKIEQHCTL